MFTQPLLLCDPLLFLLLYLNHIIQYEILSCHFCTQYFFSLPILWFICIYVHYKIFINCHFYQTLGPLCISFIKYFISSSFYANHTVIWLTTTSGFNFNYFCKLKKISYCHNQELTLLCPFSHIRNNIAS